MIPVKSAVICFSLFAFLIAAQLHGQQTHRKTWSLDLPPGEHTLTVYSQTADGRTSSGRTINIYVNAPPNTAYSSLPNNKRFINHLPIIVGATASDDRAVRKVSLQVDSGAPMDDSNPPYSWDISGLSPGMHELTLVSWDDDGEASTPKLRTIEVVDPNVYFTNLDRYENLTVGDSIGVTATHNLIGFLDRIDLFHNDDLVATEIASPYEWGEDNTNRTDLPLLNLPAGTHSLKLKAHYLGEAYSTEQEIQFSVGHLEGWTVGTIGSSSSANPFVYVDPAVNSVTLESAGQNINSTSDDIGFSNQQLPSGDALIIAKVEDAQGVDAYAKAGIMIRASMAPDAKYSALFFTPNGNLGHFRRLNKAEDAQVTWFGQPGFPCWLKLVKRDGEISGFYSRDGEDWIPTATDPITINNAPAVGLFTSARSDTDRVRGEFSEVYAEPLRDNFSSWVKTNFQPAQWPRKIRFRNSEDHDLDGVVDFIEYSTGTNPRNGNQNRPSITSGITGETQIRVQINKQMMDTVWSIESSSNLIDWAQALPTSTTVEREDAQTRTYRYAFPQLDPSNLYRIRFYEAQFPLDTIIWLKSDRTNRFLSASNTNSIRANASEITDHEKWIISQTNDGAYAIRSIGTGHFVRLNNLTAKTFNANFDGNPDDFAWARLLMALREDSRIVIQSQLDDVGFWIPDVTTNDRVAGNGTIDEPEAGFTWGMVSIPPPSLDTNIWIRFQETGTYLTATSPGDANATAITNQEAWQLTRVPGESEYVALQSVTNGGFLALRNLTEKRLWLNPTSIDSLGSWAQFKLIDLGDGFFGLMPRVAESFLQVDPEHPDFEVNGLGNENSPGIVLYWGMLP
ncbi:MAG: hypothetical protein AAFX93_11185 [Verrucomicrobiota bacterium]